MPTHTSTFCDNDCYRRLEDSLDVLLTVTQLASGDRLDEDERASVSSALAEFRETAPRQLLSEEELLSLQVNSKEHSDLDDSDELMSLKATHDLTKRRYRGVEELFQTWFKDGELPPDDTRILLNLLKQLRATFSRYLSPIRSYSGSLPASKFVPVEGSHA